MGFPEPKAEQAHRSLKQRGSPPLESRGSKHPPQTRRPHPLRPPSRRAGPRAVAAPSPAFSSRKVSQFSNFNLGTSTCIRRPECCWGALAGARRVVCAGAPGGVVARTRTRAATAEMHGWSATRARAWHVGAGSTRVARAGVMIPRLL
eukprot:COSAG02_NODE_1514_length_12189_cov_15.403060_11_plen_148_part_00